MASLVTLPVELVYRILDHQSTLEECQKAQESLEKTIPTSDKQWSSAETELSDNEDSDIASNNENENENDNIINTSSKICIKKKKAKVTTSKPVHLSSDEEEAEILHDIKRTHHSGAESNSKKFKPNDELSLEEPSTSSILLSSDIENKVAELVESNLGELKKIMTKVYVMQKRASNVGKKDNPPPSTEVMIVNNVNLMTLLGKTASRYLLSAARVVLTDEQFTNGYLPDFHGNKQGRVAIPQESVDTLREAVRKRFGYREEDMKSIWSTIRTSLVQKVSDIRKDNRRKSQRQEQQDSQEHPVPLFEQHHDLDSGAANN
ncbi:unnamed protein product [Adineta steineri]|uniref:BEN domain-containing protein n=2 Tax=Adineta steineri TaxID=433720 RepID=A0A819GNF2_9BILA|nr:unnamed protein product [Adineta steineri]